MKRVLIVLGLGLSITSCMKQSVSTSTEGIDVKVEFLFEKDGVKVYRFYDGNAHYFTTNGETITSQTSGKTHYEENIK
jgi:hypothetical protein